jgi:hypothetical protein
MKSTKVPVTSENALFSFYGIESLSNVFVLSSYTPRMNELRVFSLVEPASPLGGELNSACFDEDRARQSIMGANQALLVESNSTKVVFHNLSTWDANRVLAEFIGLSDAVSVNDPTSVSTYTAQFRPVCDTDRDFDPFRRHPYLAGYDSTSYDTVMLALYLMEAFSHVGCAVQRRNPIDHGFVAPSPLRLREWNDQLLQKPWATYMPRFLVEGTVAKGRGWDSVPHRIRQAMISSGRHIDVARFNESRQRVSLKRLLGGLGRQITESGNLRAHNTITSTEEFYELLARNVSDVVGLSKLFEHPTYSTGFDLKQGLLDEYPETIYQRRSSSYGPHVHPERVRRDRLTPDSSSAKFVGRILAPYGPLKDLEGVSYLYPCERVARATGVDQVDVLEEARRFFYANIADGHARGQFDKVYAYYKSIEGKNFNHSGAYDDTWGLAAHPPHQVKDIPKEPNTLPYFHADGTPSSCFVTFSTGGIHGAELNLPLFKEDERAWHEQDEMIRRAKHAYPDPRDLVAAVRDGSNRVTLPDGFVIDGSVVLANQGHSSAAYRGAPASRAPELFEARSDGSTKLKDRYAYTSAGKVIRQDFRSYYPVLLSRMGAFDNPDLGADRYAKLYADKERFGEILKGSGLGSVERKRLDVLREGVKLILNTASGAGDTQFATPILMNNQIISMRVIGQLFCWRIGQAQTLAGARIVSTNTDGLYSLGAETSNTALEGEAASIGVEIATEPRVVVSKDSNNRLELAVPEAGGEPLWKAPIIAAAGASLACHEEPQPTKNLAHPAVLDWALARYLRYVVGGFTPAWRSEPLSLDEPMDRRVGLHLMLQARSLNDPVRAVRLFQNVVAASPGKLTFPFAADPVDPMAGGLEEIKNPRPLGHCNRAFVVHQGKPGSCSLRAAGARRVTEASRAKRQRGGQAPTVTDPVALAILRANGFARTRVEAHLHGCRLLPVDQDVAVRRVPGVDPAWSVLIENGDLLCMPEARLRELLGYLDLDAYVDMLAASFDKNWQRVGVTAHR